MISAPVGAPTFSLHQMGTPTNAALYVRVIREGDDSGRFDEVGWMTPEVAAEENATLSDGGGLAAWHRVESATVEDFPA